ncbi:Meiotic Sister-Chromatid recombination aldehyde dehydrogenase, partial [Coemansia sp. RSA 2559]
MNCISELFVLDTLPATVAIVAGSVVLYFMFFFKKSLPAIRFELRPPAESIPGWSGNEILDTPSIFVKGQPDVIQCFDPATGRSLGQVKATT